MKLIFRNKKMFSFVGALIVSVGLSSNVHAWSHNEHNTNNSGATAFDVVKILDGDYKITNMMEWDFKSHDYYHRCVDGKIQTVLRWWDGQVPEGDRGDVCFTAVPLNNSNPHAKIVGAWWTDENGVPTGEYIPAVSVDVQYKAVAIDKWYPDIVIENNQATEIKVNVDNPNRWKDGDFATYGEAAPVPVYSVLAIVIPGSLNPRTLTIENLMESYGYPGKFQPLIDQVDIAYGEPIRLKGELVVSADESLVLVMDLGKGNYDLFNFEAPKFSSNDNETALGSKAGVPAAALLLTMAGLIFFRRRRRRQSNP